jgi:hypothetical protein
MPADFGEIAAYHRQEAARHYALAQAARDRECYGEAEYQTGLAARWDQAAREQRIEMRRDPVRPIANHRPNRRPPEPQHTRSAAACLLAVLRGVQRIAAAIRQSLAKLNVSRHGLTLR